MATIIQNKTVTAKAHAMVFSTTTRKVTERTQTVYAFGEKLGKYRFALAADEKLGKVWVTDEKKETRYMLASVWNAKAEQTATLKLGTQYKNVRNAGGWDVTGVYWNEDGTDTVERTERVFKKDATPKAMLLELSRVEVEGEGYTYMDAKTFVLNSYPSKEALAAVTAATAAKDDADAE